MQQRRFTGTGTTNHRHELASVEVEVDVIQNALTRFIGFHQAFHVQHFVQMLWPGLRIFSLCQLKLSLRHDAVSRLLSLSGVH
ncbi:hypothetical protein D3C80_2101010 [compost metagenome]